MNEINDPGMNPRISEAQYAGQLKETQTVQEGQKLGMYLDNVLGADGGTAVQGVNLDAVMSGCLNGYLGIGEIALAGSESPLASSEVLNQVSQSQTIQPPVGMDQTKALESLTGFNTSDVSEVALGLIPGLGMNMAVAEKTNPVAVSEILDKSPAAEVGMNTEQKMAMGNLDSLSNWESELSSEVARLENQGGNAVAVKGMDENTLAMNVEPGRDFDVRPMAAQPVIEGNRGEYSNNWSQLSDVLDRSDTGGTNLVGVADWLGEPIHSNAGIGYNQNAPQATLGYHDTQPSNQLMGYHSVVNKELLGFLDLSTYSQSMAMGVNPGDSVAMLKPGKYVSNLIDGYYT